MNKNRRKKNRQIEAQKSIKWIWPRVAEALKKRLINRGIEMDKKPNPELTRLINNYRSQKAWENPKTETTEEFLKRGGSIKKVGSSFYQHKTQSFTQHTNPERI